MTPSFGRREVAGNAATRVLLEPAQVPEDIKPPLEDIRGPERDAMKVARHFSGGKLQPIRFKSRRDG